MTMRLAMSERAGESLRAIHAAGWLQELDLQAVDG